LELTAWSKPLPKGLANRFRYVGPGAVLAVQKADQPRLPDLHRQQVLLVQEDAAGRVIQSASLQIAGALDDRYISAAQTRDLGVTLGPQHTQFKLWAPTAQSVSLCRFDSSSGAAVAAQPLQSDFATGNWSMRHPKNLTGGYYSYLVDVFVPGVGLVRNRVTDPYSLSLNTDSQRSYIADLSDTRLKPPAGTATPPRGA
jgi:pullulanase